MPRDLPVVDVSPACCTPLSTAPLGAPDATELASRLKALADPNRLRLLSILLAKDDLTACTCELTGPLGLGQPTVSHHLRRLHEAGLVDAERRGVWTFYRARPDALVALAAALTPAGEPVPTG